MHPTRKLPVGFSDQPILILMLKIRQTPVTSCIHDRYTKITFQKWLLANLYKIAILYRLAIHF